MSAKKNILMDAMNFIFAFLMIYFFFFGIVCNIGGTDLLKEPGDRLLFVYRNFFTTLTLNWAGLFPPDWMQWVQDIPGWICLFVFLIIGFIQAYSEDLLVYAIKNNMIMVIFILIISWIWYSINYEISIFITIARYFSNIEGYINIVVLFVTYVAAGFLGGWFKIYLYRKRILKGVVIR